MLKPLNGRLAAGKDAAWLAGHATGAMSLALRAACTGGRRGSMGLAANAVMIRTRTFRIHDVRCFIIPPVSGSTMFLLTLSRADNCDELSRDPWHQAGAEEQTHPAHRIMCRETAMHR